VGFYVRVLIAVRGHAVCGVVGDLMHGGSVVQAVDLVGYRMVRPGGFRAVRW
jgi:hypothetical protein